MFLKEIKRWKRGVHLWPFNQNFSCITSFPKQVEEMQAENSITVRALLAYIAMPLEVWSMDQKPQYHLAVRNAGPALIQTYCIRTFIFFF